ncbi:hypothetical protein GSI_13906 [Ganoderma sinense ZZ0214-1]|uniref:Uncharacterized protein n=1 Tax=Ganoderma sinense ZZ0214-1 TaxID=1077348 RepID=A0A2G8RRM8_9APHY|nr:hypothetical protein GSI_13906 [Ganoderma sinense ZZ0214-1]
MTHMALSAGFRLVRTWVFAVTTFVSFLWVVLLCVEIFALYDQSDSAQRSLVGVLIFINAVTAVMLPVLAILPFRPWLDAARLLFLLLVHIGTALLFTLWDSTFSCPSEPVSWRLWHEDQKQMLEEEPEKRLSELPMMLPSNRHPALGPDNKLASNVPNMPPASRGSLSPSLQMPPRPLPIPPQSQALSQPSQPVSQPLHPQMNPIVPPTHLSTSQYSQPTIQGASTRWSQPPPSIGSVYSASQSSRRSRPSLTLQVPSRPPSQPPSARPPSHLPSPRPPSHLPSPSTAIPQKHSRSSSQARLHALAMQPAQPVDDTGDRYSPRASGRLSKPMPLQWAY